MKRSARLTWRFALLPALAVAVLTCVMLGFEHHLLDSELTDRALIRNQQRADVLGLQLQAALGESVHQVRLLARSPLMRPGTAPAARMREELERLTTEAPRFVWVGVVGLDGRVLAGSRGWLEGQSIAKRPVFAEGVQGMVGDVHRAVVLAPLLAQLPGGVTELIDIGEPVRDETGRPVAVVTAHLGLGWVRRQIDLSLGEPDTARAYGLQGLVLTGPDSRSVLPDGQRPEGLPGHVPKALAWQGTGGRTLLVAESALRGGEADQAPLLPWRVVVTQSLDTVLAPVDRLTASMVWVGGAATLLLAVLGMLTSRRMLLPWHPVFEAILEDEAEDDSQRYSTQITTKVRSLLAANAAPSPTERLMGWLARDADTLRRAMDHLPVALALTDAHYRVEYVNAAYTRLLGWTSETCRGHLAGEALVDPAERDILRRMYQQLGDPPGEVATRLEALTRSGERVAVQWHLVPTFDAAGRCVGALSIVDDIRAEHSARARADAMAGRLRALADAALDTLLATLDIDGRVLEWSRGAEQLTGSPAAEALGRPLHQLLGCEHRFAALLRRARIDGRSQVLGPLTVADGSSRWFEGSIYALGLAPGSARLGVILRDVSRQHATYNALETSEARLRLAIDAARLGAWEIDLTQSPPQAIWSEGYARMLGRPEGEGARPSTRLDELVHPADWPRLNAALAHAARSGEPLHIEFRIQHAQGWRHHALHGQAVRDADGQATHLTGVGMDVTDQHLARQAVVDSEARLAAIVTNASDAVISISADSSITLFNPAAERIFGYTAAQMLGTSVERLLPERVRPRHQGLVNQFTQSGASQRVMGVGRVQGLRADGRLVELEASISQAFTNEQVVLTAILRDVTERAAQERLIETTRDELGQLNRRLLEQEKQTSRKLAQGLHDELGQTLAALRLHWDAYRGAAAEQRARLDERIAHLVVLANRQIRGVLSDLRPPLLDELGLAAALDNEIRQHLGAEGAAGIRLYADDATQDQRWLPDVEYAVFMIAREALINALRHAAAAHIGVHLGGDGNHLELRVEDDGVGIPPLGRAARPGHLGLVGMRERAHAIGATLRVDGGPGHGTMVVLTWAQEPVDDREDGCTVTREPLTPMPNDA